MPADNSTLVHEGRLLPALIAGFALAVSALVFIFATDGVSRAFGIGMILVSIWPAYRAFRPRWILQLGRGKLLFNDLVARRTVEVGLSSGVTIECRRRTAYGVGPEGGVGFWKELVINSPNGITVFQLPFLEISAAKACDLVRTAILKNEEAVSPARKHAL
jgi:hypothetical protein